MRTSRTLGLAVSLFALAPSLAWAQGTAADPTQVAASDDEEIVITGSRIPRRPEFEAPNPMVSVGADTLQQAGTTNLTDSLMDIPALIGSFSSGFASGDDSPIGFTGLNLLNLRNLGFSRTLVLVDGRRHVAAIDGDQAVDINTIPTDLISRVDVLTGGVSAIYGADAVTGVVNFVLKKDFEGINARAQTGISEFGDSAQHLLSLTAGTNFAGGRGNVAVAFEYGRDDRLEARDRRQLRGTNMMRFVLNPNDPENLIAGTPNNGIPDNILLSNVRFFDSNREGGIDVDIDGRPDFVVVDGRTVPFDPGSFLPGPFQLGGNATLVSDYLNDLRPQVDRYVANFVGHYNFSDAVTLYGEAKYARVDSFSLQQPSFDYFLLVTADNPFIPTDARNQIIPGIGGFVFGPGAPDFVLINRDNFDFGRRGEDIKRETIRTVVGLRGEIATNLDYDLSYVYGQTKVRNRYIGNHFDDRFYAALDVVQGPNGPTCRVNLQPNWTPFQPFASFNPTARDVLAPTTFAPGQCVPLNLFGEGAPSQAAIDWITADTVDRSKIQQHVVTAVLTGKLGVLSLPGGDIGFALGAEYRKEKSNFIPDPIATQGLTASNAIAQTKGSFNVKEAFAEVQIPIFRSQPFVERLDVGGAVRFSDYSTVGSTWTWKVDASYAPVRDISFHGTYSQVVRAPNIGELFSGESDTFQSITDPCNFNELQNGTQFRAANCATLLSGLGVANPAAFFDTRSVTLRGTLGGNPNLTEETAKTWTAGVVLRPSFIPGLTVRADWYDIKLKNAINFVTPEEAAQLCVDQPILNNPFCALVTRASGGPFPGFIVDFEQRPQNVSQFRTAGLDLNVNYQFELDNIGRFNLQLIANYLDRLEFVGTPGAPVNSERGEGFSPKYQATFDLTFKSGPVTLNYGLSWFDKTLRYTNLEVDGNPDIVAPEFLKIKERWVHDIYASVDVTDRFQLYGGVNNVFGQRPDYKLVSTSALGTEDYPVSAVGRFFYMGAKVSLPSF